LVIARSFQEDAIDIRLRGVIGVDVRLAAVTHDYPDRGFGRWQVLTDARQVTPVTMFPANSPSGTT